MTPLDLTYVEGLLQSQRLQGPVLELGAGWGGITCRALLQEADVEYVGTDLFAAQGVDFVADFVSGEGMDAIRNAHTGFGGVLVLNVLEHTFDPIRVLDNASDLLKPGGCLVCITPAAWPLHGYPIDCCRLLPDWYRAYAVSRGLCLDEDSFRWLGYGRVRDCTGRDGKEMMPVPFADRPARRLWSRLVHKALRTFGRGMGYPSHLAIGAVLTRSRTD